MGKCNLEMTPDCYGCVYYGTGDTEGCNLTIKFHKKHPDPADEEYADWMARNGRKEKSLK